MIDHLVECAFNLAAIVVMLGVPFLVIGGLMSLSRRLNIKPPCPAMRDWRDHYKGGRRHAV